MKKGTKSIFFSALLLFIVGILLCVVGLASGGSVTALKDLNVGYADLIDVDEKFVDQITSLDIELAAGNLTIQQGEEFRIEGKNIPDGHYEFYVKDNTLYVEKKNKGWLHLDFDWFDWDDNWKSMQITVYVPSGFQAENLKLNVAAGAVKVEDMVTSNAEIKMSAGTVNVSNLSILEEGQIKVNAGALNMDNITANNVKVKQNAGSATLEGSFLGKTTLECNAGNMSLTTDKKESEYQYSIDSNAGSIKINGEKYSNIEKEINNNAEYEFNMECNAGSIQLNTK